MNIAAKKEGTDLDSQHSLKRKLNTSEVGKTKLHDNISLASSSVSLSVASSRFLTEVSDIPKIN